MKIEAIAQNIAKAIEELEKDFTFVLDDFHILKDPKIQEFMNHFLRMIPSTVKMVVSSRQEPNLKFEEMKLYDKILFMDKEDLRLTQEEIVMVVSASDENCLNSDSLSELIYRSEGWILGIKLLCASIRLKGNTASKDSNLSKQK